MLDLLEKNVLLHFHGRKGLARIYGKVIGVTQQFIILKDLKDKTTYFNLGQMQRIELTDKLKNENENNKGRM